MRIERVVLYSCRRKIVGVLHSPDGEEEVSCVVTCHGYLSSKDSEKYIEISNRFCSEGLAVFRFDFRGCGESEGEIRDTTLSGRVCDLKAVLRFLRSRSRIGHIGLLGSSMGGCTAIITAAVNEEVKAVAVWSTPSHLSGFFKENKLRRDFEGYDLKEIVGKVDKPILIVHGAADELVPSYQAMDLYDRAKEPKRLEIIERGDHRLTNPRNRKRAIELSLEWFKAYLQYA